MPAVYDYRCSFCGAVKLDVLAPSVECAPVCDCNGMPMDWLPSLRQKIAPCHPSENVVVYRHPGTGDVKYPGRADRPMPERYRRQGYERQELRHDRDIRQFETVNKVRHEKTWFDSNGKSFDVDPPPVPKLIDGKLDIAPAKQ